MLGTNAVTPTCNWSVHTELRFDRSVALLDCLGAVVVDGNRLIIADLQVVIVLDRSVVVLNVSLGSSSLEAT